MKSKWVILVVLGVVLLTIGTGGYAYGASLENNDAFCGSCHTEPETTYLQNNQQGNMPDLASFHAAQGARCIDCHSGKGIPGRAKAMTTGMLDMLAYKSGSYRRPATTTRPEGNAGCTKCHNMPLIASGEGGANNGHFHADTVQLSWRLRGGPVNGCATCHPAHTAADAGQKYMQTAQIDLTCDSCHAVTGEGGRGSGGGD